MAVVADIRRIAPEFAAIPDEDVQTFLDEAGAQLNPKMWGVRHGQAHARLAAHLLALSRPDLACGANPESIGNVTRLYPAPIGLSVPGEYAGSRHGIAFYQLLHTLELAILVA